MTRLSKKNTDRNLIPLPYNYYYIPVIFVALAGLFSTIYLAVSHYRVHADMSYSSFCAISRALNCDTVSSSPYAVFLGVPVAVWGGLGYAGALLILFFAGSRSAEKKGLWSLFFWVSFLFIVVDTILCTQ